MGEISLRYLEERHFLQGEQSATCYAQVLVNRILLNNREEIERAASDLVKFGRAKLRNLELVTPSCGVEEIRKYAEANGLKFEVALVTLSVAESINGSEFQIKVDPASGVVVSQGKDGAEIKGGRPDWILAGAKRLFGENMRINAYDIRDRSKWDEALKSGKLNESLLSLYVDDSRHILLIREVRNGRVYFVDSFSSDISYYRKLFGDAARKEGPVSWSVDIDTLLDSNRIAYTICDGSIFAEYREFTPTMPDQLESFIPIMLYFNTYSQQAQRYLTSRDKNRSKRN